MRTIIAIDPGKATGLVVLKYNDMENIVDSYESFEYDQIEVCSFLDSLDEMKDEHIEIVFEKFFITPETGKKNDVHYSLEIIGVIRYFSWKYGIPIFSQSPSDAKNFVSNDRLRAVDLWHVGGAGHAKDALRHMVLHLVKNRGWRPDGLIEGTTGGE